MRSLTPEQRQKLADDSGLMPEQLERWLNRRLTATTVEAPAPPPAQEQDEEDEEVRPRPPAAARCSLPSRADSSRGAAPRRPPQAAAADASAAPEPQRVRFAPRLLHSHLLSFPPAPLL